MLGNTTTADNSSVAQTDAQKLIEQSKNQEAQHQANIDDAQKKIDGIKKKAQDQITFNKEIETFKKIVGDQSYEEYMNQVKDRQKKLKDSGYQPSKPKTKSSGSVGEQLSHLSGYSWEGIAVYGMLSIFEFLCTSNPVLNGHYHKQHRDYREALNNGNAYVEGRTKLFEVAKDALGNPIMEDILDEKGQPVMGPDNKPKQRTMKSEILNPTREQIRQAGYVPPPSKLECLHYSFKELDSKLTKNMDQAAHAQSNGELNQKSRDFSSIFNRPKPGKRLGL